MFSQDLEEVNYRYLQYISIQCSMATVALGMVFLELLYKSNTTLKVVSLFQISVCC